MSVELHRQAEALMARADLFASAGQTDDARPLYGEAARLEAQTFDVIPSSRPRTRGIIAVSAVSLFTRAGDLRTAVLHAHRFLADGSIHGDARLRLRDLLDEAESLQRARDLGQELSDHRVLVLLKGERVLYGLAPLDLVVIKLKQIENYVIRVGEWVMKRPFRKRAVSDEELHAHFVPMLGAFQGGSFQFEVRIAAPVQPELPLFELTREAGPNKVADEFFTIIELVAKRSGQELEERVADPKYREIFVKLVRNLVPDGKDVREVEIRRIGLGTSAVAVLRPEARTIVKGHLPPSPTQFASGTESVEIGTLRALDLDKGWIILSKQGERHKLPVAPDKVLDDVVGPLVNRKVGVELQRSRHRAKFLVVDIYEAASDE